MQLVQKVLDRPGGLTGRQVRRESDDHTTVADTGAGGAAACRRSHHVDPWLADLLLARPEGERTPPETWRLPLTVPALPDTL